MLAITRFPQITRRQHVKRYTVRSFRLEKFSVFKICEPLC